MNYAVKVWEPFENPIGLNGFSFLEFAAPNPADLTVVLERFGFRHKAQDNSRTVALYTQGGINLIINNKLESCAATLGRRHGPLVSAMGWRVRDAEFAFWESVRRGAKPFENTEAGLGIPAIYGIGDSLIYFVDDEGAEKLYSRFFIANPDYVEDTAASLQFIDHLDHIVRIGRMKYWAAFYEKVFNFRQIDYYNIEAKVTGLVFTAMGSPCGKMAIPIGESAKGRSFVKEYLEKFQGEGVNHVAFHTDNLCEAVEYMHARGQKFLPISEKYYKTVNERVPGHREDVERLKKNGILIDGDTEGYLLQIFTIKEPTLDPLFFEFITRRSFQGFGEGNVTTLFEALETDQFRRGYLKKAQTQLAVR